MVSEGFRVPPAEQRGAQQRASSGRRRGRVPIPGQLQPCCTCAVGVPAALGIDDGHAHAAICVHVGMEERLALDGLEFDSRWLLGVVLSERHRGWEEARRPHGARLGRHNDVPDKEIARAIRPLRRLGDEMLGPYAQAPRHTHDSRAAATRGLSCPLTVLAPILPLVLQACLGSHFASRARQWGGRTHARPRPPQRHPKHASEAGRLDREEADDERR